METKITFEDFLKSYTNNPKKWAYEYSSSDWEGNDGRYLFFNLNSKDCENWVMVNMTLFDKVKVKRFFERKEKEKQTILNNKIKSEIVKSIGENC